MAKDKMILNEVILHDDEYYYDISRKNIKKYRIKKNLTQQNLSDITGISRQYICDIENENRSKHVTLANLGRIADALGVDIRTLFNPLDTE